MPIKDPIVAYVAASNMEAHLLKSVLLNAQIDAAVEEDVSQMGVWMFGIASQLHRPKVWVERADLDRAKQILAAYEDETAARRAADASTADMIEVTCEDCGATSPFPAAQLGTVQTCPKCQGYIDIGDDDPGFDWK
jgi:hypothetical protein